MEPVRLGCFGNLTVHANCEINWFCFIRTSYHQCRQKCPTQKCRQKCPTQTNSLEKIRMAKLNSDRTILHDGVLGDRPPDEASVGTQTKGLETSFTK